jgi:hypothetical protein
MREKYEAVTKITDEFGHEHLNKEYVQSFVIVGSHPLTWFA